MKKILLVGVLSALSLTTVAQEAVVIPVEDTTIQSVESAIDDKPSRFSRLKTWASEVCFFNCDDEEVVADDDELFGDMEVVDSEGEEVEVAEEAVTTVPDAVKAPGCFYNSGLISLDARKASLDEYRDC